jgi:hypothetical protein
VILSDHDVQIKYLLGETATLFLKVTLRILMGLNKLRSAFGFNEEGAAPGLGPSFPGKHGGTAGKFDILSRSVDEFEEDN